ncbi:26S proteasome non-ATPase regulatory subunit 7 [Thecamonas trahens ATCC 50062]|uniref:26S proteasome non-ATPase regulatory subunit 7 n=1 Tax=Thecamonas trahens ATCC 50062 TaxID=461836 RepID=A0A0L0DR60_THETB|nr:26S proteasome non-ATPase regulatory subunit 7 [Thecamonas trahens ATCC 50062]KNC54760.1 26S proteasome non-ATPase regulatory subunit 7 [Thecamonas trahens ATCC 50062]|eukprot:XP_013761660.1 26S proteasome non-ATPase regulatory subunit 7 [Thecamonas trahens ATCC 50062]
MQAPTSVTVHPVVLLSVVDHYNRVASGSRNKRVVGVLLGEKYKDGRIDVTNSFAVPFDENSKNPGIFYLNHDFLERMFGMFKKVAAKEKIVGWYHSGPKIRESDLAINEIFRGYVRDPVLTIIDAYYAVEEIPEDGSEPRKTFRHIASDIGAEEAEEVGVEHLLRDINDSTLSTLSNEVKHKLNGLRGLGERLRAMQKYLENVVNGVLPVNHEIVAQIQDVFNLLPNISSEGMVKAFAVKTNDNMVVLYLAALIRSVLALHNLLNNKIFTKSAEQKADEELDAADAAAAKSAAAASAAATDASSSAKSGKDAE